MEVTQLISQEVLRLVLEYGDYKYILWTGSRHICSPPVEDTDLDAVIIYNSKISAHLQSRGFVISPHEEYPNQEIRACYRRDDINIIAVDTEDAFFRWSKAHALAKHMNLREKAQRIALFQFITEGSVRGLNIKY